MWWWWLLNERKIRFSFFESITFKHTVQGGGGGAFVPGGGGGPGNGGNVGREGWWDIGGGGARIFGGGKWKGFGGCWSTRRKEKSNKKRWDIILKFYLQAFSAWTRNA